MTSKESEIAFIRRREQSLRVHGKNIVIHEKIFAYKIYHGVSYLGNPHEVQFVLNEKTFKCKLVELICRVKMDTDLAQWILDYDARKIRFWKDALDICNNKGVSDAVAFLTVQYMLTKLFLE